MPLFHLLKEKSQGVHHAALLLAVSSFSSGLLALLRDRLLAGVYGASGDLDIYYASFRVPDFIFSLSLFFAASTAFIPIFLERKQRSATEAQDFFDSIFTVCIGATLFLAATAYIVIPIAIQFIAPGFTDSARLATVHLSRILLFSPLILGVSNLVSGVLQSSKKFLACALSPIVYNLGIISGIVFLYPYFGRDGLAYGVVIGVVLHLCVQIPTLRSLHAFPRVRFLWESNPFQIFWYSFPRALALTVNQVTLLVLTALASLLGAGAISIFNLSSNLYSLPLSVIGLSYSVAAFPFMMELVLKQEQKLFFQYLVTATRHIFFWTFPIVGLFIVLRAHIVRLVLGTGAFAWADTRLTAASLALFAFAIIFQSIVTLFVRGYYALGKVREPIAYNSASAIITIMIAVLFVYLTRASVLFETFFGTLFRIQDLPQVEFLSLPFAFTVGSLVNAILLGFNLFRINGKEELQQIGASVRRIALVSICMSAGAYLVLQALSFMTLDTFISVLIQGGGAAIVAYGIGGVLASQFKIQEYQEIQGLLHARFRRVRMVQPETEHI